ncbi:oleate hydratase [Luteibacter sp. Sphag1AF]|uniref:oleate hydratase n=1 Tax=Luteibacter sp. Sphag1AF TaxID=2587031 RepID=UPI0017AAD32F|nr:oleate hydratase [Luteibacter sp. Sphag1AF]MBB3227965.1 oleate hydratase [Luteibacter sp. Sphag1AF]
MPTIDTRHVRAHLIGGGIASLATAVFLIRDGGVPGRHITIYEESGRFGGALDGAGDPTNGYVVRGGRMIESKYLCTYDLFDSIPTLDGGRTVTEEIMAWNRVLKTDSKARLVRGGQPIPAPPFGLTERQIVTLEALAVTPEAILGDSSIADRMDRTFFGTNFWLMWCTTFAFQPWHSAVEFKRYLVRFIHMVGGFNRLRGIMRTVYNQYDSMVLPLSRWLKDRGVRFEANTEVTDLGFVHGEDGERVEAIFYRRDGVFAAMTVRPDDIVVATLGSMTEASSLGDMDHAPVLPGKKDGGAWSFWERIARNRPHLGNPRAFCDHADDSRWTSFTLTLRDPALLQHILDMTGNVPGEGGLITFADSRWLMSIVVPHQPHFIGQPDGVQVVWGYALDMSARGNFVDKPIGECSGREILTELLGQLGIDDSDRRIAASTTCIPCMMPFITSQFLRRKAGDRPQVRPEGFHNLAIVGQFCEQPDDVVFTVEYSVRSAMTAAWSLLGLTRKPPQVYKAKHDPTALRDAYRALHSHGATAGE